jgi:hypothetical protein
MKYQADSQQQIVMEQYGKSGMEMSMYSCHTTLYVFGALVIIGLLIQIILQSKMLKALRKANKKR